MSRHPGPTVAVPVARRARTAARRRALLVCVALLLSLLAAPPSPARAAVLPAGFTQAVVASGLGPVTAMAFAPDGRLFVVTQNGTVRILRDGQLLATPFLRLPVNYAGERGLTGIAFDPAFTSNGFVYLHYTVQATPAHNRVSRFVADGDVARSIGGVPAETVLVELDALGADRLIHNSGAMDFGPDGKLYITTGDNGVGSSAQSLTNRFGKVLRVNADGSIPADNPFIGRGAEGPNRAIWAMGLRNPFSFGFSRTTGRLFVNDVGQDTWEEINDGIAGSNYGWPTTEGPTSDTRFRSPVYAYGHTGTSVTGCAITGGAFYEPTTPRYPADYTGDYFFADYCSNWIKRRDASGTITDFMASSSPAPIDLKVGPDGSLYYLSRTDQSVVRVDYAAGLPPSITQQPASQTVSVGEPASFTVAAAGATPLTYQWQRHGVDVAGATAPTYRIAQTATGDSAARFRAVVRNSLGTATSSEAVLTVTTNKRPVAAITAPTAGATYAGGDVVAYSGTGTDPETGALPATAFTWRVDFHHADHTHPFLLPTSGSRSGSFTVPTTGHVDSNVWYRIHLKVQDGAGLTGQTYRDVVPRKAGLTVTTVPTGLRVDVDDQPRSAPYQEQAVVGMQRRLSAPATQLVGGVEYDLVSWSDGGAATHHVTTTAADTTYTATYRARSPRTVTLNPVADTMARQAAPTTASGAASTLFSDGQETASTTSRANAYLRFTVPTLLAGESISAAQLSLHVTDATTNGPAVWRTGTTWTETTMTWDSGQPARTGSAAAGNFASMGTGRVSTPVSGITTAGAVSLQLYAEATDGVFFAARESGTAANRPQLVLTIVSSSTDPGATVPTAPTSLTASKDDAAHTGTITWAPPTSDGGSAITGYRVSRDGTDTAGAGPWSTVVAATTRSFTFARLAPGSTYRLSVAAVNAVGTGPAATGTVTMSGSTRTVTLNPVADTMVRQQSPTTTAGSTTSLLSDSEQTTGVLSRATSYLRFTVPTLAAGETITSARLSLNVTNGTTNGPALWRTGTAWTESTMTWNSGQPARTGTAAVGNFTTMGLGRVSTPVAGISTSGAVSLQVHAETADGIAFSSREDVTTANRPQLVLTVTSAG